MLEEILGWPGWPGTGKNSGILVCTIGFTVVESFSRVAVVVAMVVVEVVVMEVVVGLGVVVV